MEHIKQPDKINSTPQESIHKWNSIGISNLKEKFEIKINNFKKNVDKYIWTEQVEKKGKTTTIKHINNILKFKYNQISD